MQRQYVMVVAVCLSCLSFVWWAMAPTTDQLAVRPCIPSPTEFVWSHDIMVPPHLPRNGTLAQLRFLLQRPLEHVLRYGTSGFAICALALTAMQHVCHIESGRETAQECIDRVGPHALHRALPLGCVDTPFWKQMLARPHSLSKLEVELRLNGSIAVGGSVRRMSSIPYAKPFPYVQPAERTAVDAPYRTCEKLMATPVKIHPIGFAIPKRLLAKRVSRAKFLDWFPIVPSERGVSVSGKPLNAQSESIAHALLRYSFFAFTHRRGGWDCWRTVEILAAGTIPWFWDLNQSAPYTLRTYPRELLMKAFDLPGVQHVSTWDRRGPGANVHRDGHVAVFNLPAIDWQTFNMTQYFALADEIHDYTQKYLTAGAMVARILRVLGVEEPRNVLHVANLIECCPEYLSVTVEEGLIELGLNYSNSHERPWVYQPNRTEGAKVSKWLTAPGSPEFDDGINAAENLPTHLMSEVEISQRHGHIDTYGIPSRLQRLRNPVVPADAVAHGGFDLVIFSAFYELNFRADEHPQMRVAVEKIQAYVAAVSRLGLPKERVALIISDDGGGLYPVYFESGLNGTYFLREMRGTDRFKDCY